MAKSGINIKPSHEGLFTAKAKEHKMSVQEFAVYVLAHPKDFDAKIRVQARFARTVKTKFNH
jgi:hypothetical protein